jgi:hypothetical protein
VADEILVDLMRLAGGIDYVAAAADVVVRDVDGVPTPFASPRGIGRMNGLPVNRSLVIRPRSGHTPPPGTAQIAPHTQPESRGACAGG